MGSPSIHSWLNDLVCGENPLGEPGEPKQSPGRALHCSWSIETLFIHRHIGIQGASALFFLITQQVAIFMHVKVEGKLFMGGWSCRKRTNALWLKWFTLRAILFYIGYWIRCITARYACIIHYSAFLGLNRRPGRQSSCPLDTVMHLRHATFQVRV